MDFNNWSNSLSPGPGNQRLRRNSEVLPSNYVNKIQTKKTIYSDLSNGFPSRNDLTENKKYSNINNLSNRLAYDETLLSKSNFNLPMEENSDVESRKMIGNNSFYTNLSLKNRVSFDSVETDTTRPLSSQINSLRQNSTSDLSDAWYNDQYATSTILSNSLQSQKSNSDQIWKNIASRDSGYMNNSQNLQSMPDNLLGTRNSNPAFLDISHNLYNMHIVRRDKSCQNECMKQFRNGQAWDIASNNSQYSPRNSKHLSYSFPTQSDFNDCSNQKDSATIEDTQSTLRNPSHRTKYFVKHQKSNNYRSGYGEFKFQLTTKQAQCGNIFKKRRDISAFKVAPIGKQNSFNIKIYDEGPHGNDEIRTFVLSNLSIKRVTSLICVVCTKFLDIYDSVIDMGQDMSPKVQIHSVIHQVDEIVYPLLDGMIFLSPMQYYEKYDLKVNYGTKNLPSRDYNMVAVCINCMCTPNKVTCKFCGKSVIPKNLLCGTMYSYDVFNCYPCCKKRMCCNNCNKVLVNTNELNQMSFGDFSKSCKCPYCKTVGYHYIKNLHTICVISNTSKSKSQNQTG
ncbi:hypothetical protein A3Q56_03073 [Intoshia linei]|uniref:Headcase middle domain-containing protein n=1 Tax=Intoshia linei TaxID=1819745 RepID=A0A177B4F4_9BILA|nr:hypothetical protein A3Q56_03073 [Intoshia linei]